MTHTTLILFLAAMAAGVILALAADLDPMVVWTALVGLAGGGSGYQLGVRRDA